MCPLFIADQTKPQLKEMRLSVYHGKQTLCQLSASTEPNGVFPFPSGGWAAAAGLERAALPVWGAEGGCSSEAVAGELPSALSFAVFLACSGIRL